MKNHIRLIILFLVFVAAKSYAQNNSDLDQKDSFDFTHDSTEILINNHDTLAIDTIPNLYQTSRSSFGLLDTITNDTILLKIFKAYNNIQNPYYEKKSFRKNIPSVKEIKARMPNSEQWKFWIILFILFYIAFVRIANSNNFRVFIQSVFNLKLSKKIWEDQRSFFGFVILQLFAIYIFIASLFIVNYLELKAIKLWEFPLYQFGIIVIILFVVYSIKFIIHALLGSLFKMQNLGIGFVSNTISVNNFIALIIFPFLVFSIYAVNNFWAEILAQTIIIIFFLSIIYRIIRIVLLSNSFFSFPTFYLFLYLCALEIVPWFIIVKFITNYNI